MRYRADMARMRAGERGFTLVELMVVVVIIGLASAAVALAIPDPRGRLADEADRFAVRVRAAHDEAIIEARSVSVWVAPAGYGFDMRAGGTWRPMADKAFRVTRWGKDTRPMLAGAGGRDRVIFDSTGLANAPLDVVLARDDARVTIRIAPDGTVRVDG